MKFFGKNSLNSQLISTPPLNASQQSKLDSLVEQPGIIGVDVSTVAVPETHKSSSVKLVNYVEPYTITGTRFTLFYTELDTKFLVGDRVFIISGNYDSDQYIQRDPYSGFADGYKVLYVDRTKVVLDIPYDGTLPWVEEDIDNFIKVYVARNEDDFNYFLQTTSTRDFPYLVNRFANFGTFSTNNLLYIDGTYSVPGDTWGILGFTSSGSITLTHSNSFLILAGTTSGYLQDVTDNINNGIFSRFLSATLECNRNLYIMNGSFTLSDGTEFRTGNNYRYCNICSGWRTNVSFRQPFITRLNFRNGRFLRGRFNQGLMGTHVRRLIHNSDSDVIFSLGTILNTDWSGGQILTGQLLGNEQQDPNSYFTRYNNVDVPFVGQLRPNNSDWGYNLVYESYLNNVQITQATIYDSILGNTLNTVVYEYLLGLTSSYDVTISKKAQVYNSKIYKTLANFVDFYSSQIFNSTVRSSKSINSEIEKSVFLRSRFISDKIIKLDNYDERNVTWWNDGVLDTFKLYKFYVSKEVFSRLVESQNFYFDGIDINKTGLDVLNFFDDKFSFDAYKLSYDTTTGKPLRKVIAQLSTAAENIKTISNSDITYQNYLVDNEKETLPSIDLLISPGEDFNTFEDIAGDDIYTYNLANFSTSTTWGTATGSFGVLINNSSFTFSSFLTFSSILDELNNIALGTWTRNDDIFQVQGLQIYGPIAMEDDDAKVFSANPSQNIFDVVETDDTILKIDRAYIIDSDFKSGLFVNSTWVSGNHINYNLDHTIVIPNDTNYANVSIDNSGANMTVTLGSKLRRSIIKSDEVVFFNGLYLDSSLLGYDNLVRLPDAYKVTSVDYTNNNYQLEDFTNGTNSVFLTLTQSVVGVGALTNKFAENAYIYAYPTKFINSTIRSGIFRRAYFERTTFDNIEFDTTERNPSDYTNWRRLLISDTIFSDSGNTIKNGLLLYSHWLAGSDDWQNGIVQNSIWNSQTYTFSFGLTSSTQLMPQNVFKNGIFRQSRWVQGIFGNGLFYKNNSNKVYSQFVYDDSTDAYYRRKNTLGVGKTRWAFLDGIFENGTFELSHFENGLFEDGKFFNSTFLDGIATGGFFGRKQLDYTFTRVGSGTFSNVKVINANFRAENPTGKLESYFSIEWLNGIFNSGVFGVRVEGASYSTEKLNYRFKSNWYDGTFNNGSFQDTAVWHSGEFNNGSFISYFGYPFILTGSYANSSSTSFAWRDGIFNGGKFGTGDLGTNSTWFNGQFNGGIFKGRYWQNGVFTKGVFEGSGTTSTILKEVPNFVSNFSELYYGLWNSGYVNELPSTAFPDIEIFRRNIREVERGRRSNLSVTFNNVLWRGGTFSHGDGTMNNSVWLGGAFESGNFVNSSFNPYLNYFVNGEFKLSTGINNTNGSLDYWSTLTSDFIILTDESNFETLQPISGFFDSEGDGLFTKKLNYTGTSSYSKLFQTTGLNAGDSYKLRVRFKSNQNCLTKFGSFTNILQNRNFTEGYRGWMIGLTSSGLNPVPSLTIATGSPGFAAFSDTGTNDGRAYLIYPNIFQPDIEINLQFYTFNSTPTDYNFTVGSCDSSLLVLDDNGVIVTDFIENVSASFSQAGTTNANVFSETFVPVFTDLIIIIDSTPTFQQVSLTGVTVTNSKTLNSSTITSVQNIEVPFTSDGGDLSIEFIPTVTTNPSSLPIYGSASVEITSIELIRGESGFNTSENCIWKNGRFIDSEFYYSIWENGFWQNGLAMGMIWKNGIAQYMNAYNVYWQGGLWRNGNWNGSPWSFENITTDGCLFTYGTVSNPLNFKAKLSGYDLTAINAVATDPINGGVKFESADDSGNENPSSERLDGEDSSQPSPSVNTLGYFFVESESLGLIAGRRYRITVNFGYFGVEKISLKDRPAIYFSIGRPGALNPLYGPPGGGLYSQFESEATGLSNVSLRYRITDLEGHTGEQVDDLYTPGESGYQSNNAGTLTETITATEDLLMYIYADMYGCFELNISSITIELETCIQTGVINPGFARDLMTHISDYRLTMGDDEYDKVHLNNVFVEKIDQNWPSFPGTIQQSRFTFSTSGLPPGFKGWKFSNTYSEYTQNYINCPEGPLHVQAFSPVIQVPNYTISDTSSYKLYATINGEKNIFSQSGDYRIVLKYLCSRPQDEFIFPTPVEVKFDIGVGFAADAQGNQVVSNGGFKRQIVETFDRHRVATQIASSSAGSGGSQKGFGGNQCRLDTDFYARTPERTLEFIFSPLGFADYQESIADSYRFYIKRTGGSFNSLLRITYLKIDFLTTQYSPTYNNKLYGMFDSDPEFSDSLALPYSEIIAGETYSVAYSGASTTGVPISIRVGNGIFTSGDAPAFSSIWEYGAWNEGWRYDKNVIYFTNFMSFNGTNKPIVYAGVLETKKVRKGEVANEFDQNITQLMPSRRIFTVALYRTTSTLIFDDGFIANQEPTSDERVLGVNTLRQQVKVGDRVTVGNVVAIDVNGKRRVITDTFKVVDVVSPASANEGNLDIIYLQVTLNFDAKTIKRDSNEHLITISKNVWLNGAFLNGTFRGIWTNGLFRGRPYITKMKDSQWITGIFDGGHFQGKQVKYPVGTGEDLATFSVPSGLIQNFIFRDNDLSTVKYQHNYNSWIDVNYYSSSTVTIGDSTIQFNEPEDFEFQFGDPEIGEFTTTEFFSIPTNDVLRSLSLLRKNSANTNILLKLGRRFDEATNYLVVDRNKPVPSPLQEATGLIPNNDDINIGSFNRYYNTIPTTGNLKDSLKLGVSNFITDGFTYGVVGSPSTTQIFGESRLEQPRYVSNRNQNNLNVLEIVPDPFNTITTKSGNFYINKTKDVLDNTYISENFNSGRYNYISFNFVQTGSASVKFITGIPQNNIIGTAASELTTRNTNQIKEYFYNRRGLDLRYSVDNYTKTAIDKIVGQGGKIPFFSGTVSTKIDNLKFVETDMVPFFLLATESRINQRAQSPLGAEAPFIDYGDSEFSFLDQLVISETVFTPLSNPTVVVTPGSSPTDNVSFTKGPLPTTFRDDDLIFFDIIGNGRVESDSGTTDRPSSPFNPASGTKAQSPPSSGTKN